MARFSGLFLELQLLHLLQNIGLTFPSFSPTLYFVSTTIPRNGTTMQHLNKNRWFWRNKAGAWTGKRVSTEAEKQFPRRLRRIWLHGGAIALVKVVKVEENVSLSIAWDYVKWMFNNPVQPTR